MTSLKLTLKKLRNDLYDAETPEDAFRVVLRAMPHWLPWVSGTAFIAGYILTLRIRLFISRWRREIRRRVEKKYMALGYLHQHDYTEPQGGSFTLVGDDDEEDEEDSFGGDNTALTISDIEEFRRSLGIRRPRDDDLALIVEEMLLVDDIPDGWVLYRTSAGFVRFMNLNTQELSFFHPGRREDERCIRTELRRRNRVVMDAKFNFFNGDDERDQQQQREGERQRQQQHEYSSSNTSFSLKGQYRGGGRGSISPNHAFDTNANGAVLSFTDDNGDDSDGGGEQSTFGRLYRYFVEREERKIERDVEKQFCMPPPTSVNASGVSGRSGSGGPVAGSPRAESRSRSLRVVAANVVYSNAHIKRLDTS